MRHRRSASVLLAAGLTGLALFGVAEAFIINWFAIGFVPAEQFIQVNVASVGNPDDRPNPCQAAVTFFDDEGAVLKTTRLSVGNGQTRSVDLTSADVPKDVRRLLVRIQVQVGDPDDRRRCRSTTEVVGSDGKTSVFVGDPQITVRGR